MKISKLNGIGQKHGGSTQDVRELFILDRRFLREPTKCRFVERKVSI